jgi:cyclophilin family peptidyl-prolyl cis-trans isomerase
MKKSALLTAALLILLLGACGPKQPEPEDRIETVNGIQVESWEPPEGETMPEPDPETPVAVLETEHGEIAVRLYYDRAPVTVENFKGLAEDGYYDGLTFHRVEPALIQGGCPEGDGTGGPGWTIPFEDSGYNHYRGSVGMARKRDPDSAGSQFYICKVDLPSLNRDYCVFGEVLEGMEAVDAVGIGDVIESVRLTTYGEYSE